MFGVKVAAMHLLTDWREEQLKIDARVSIGGLGARSWSKPKNGWVKVNSDAAVFQDGTIKGSFWQRFAGELQVHGIPGRRRQ